jgi:hypothetical protein
MRIELLSSPGCPRAATAKETVTGCLASLGIEVTIIERVGRFPSPTVLVDGIDVMRPEGAVSGDTCRLDLPTTQRVCEAVRAHSLRSAQPPRLCTDRCQTCLAAGPF